MGMQVNTNIAANNAYRNLATTQNDLSKSLEKLSSGLRINRAADDAAGLAISEGLKSQVGGLTVASRNAQDAISVIQTAEGSLNEVTSILQRMRDLAVQAGNDSNNEESRLAITTEVGALSKELTRISDSTNFNGTKLLNGDVDGDGGTTLNFQIGADGNADSQIAVSLESSDVGAVADKLQFGTELGDIQSRTYAVGTLDDTFITAGGGDGELVFVNSDAVTVAVDIPEGITDMKELAAVLNKSAGFSQNYTAEFKAGVDADGVAVPADDELVITSRNMNDADGTDTSFTVNFHDSVYIADSTDAAAVNSTLAGVFDAADVELGFDTAANAQASITAIDDQITAVSTARAELGSYQNRFESVIKNLAVSKENLTAAGSRIRDTDMAEEMVKYTRANILSQAGTAMLAQANQSNSGVLQLLQ